MKSLIFRIAPLLLLVALGLAWRPIHLPCVERIRAADIPASAPHAVALLIVDDAVVQQSSDPADGSYAWWSALEEEFGPTAFLSPRALRSDGIPATASVAVRTASARADLVSLRALLAWAEAGHLLLLDALDASTAELLGLSLRRVEPDSLGLPLLAADVELDSLRLRAPSHVLGPLPARGRWLLRSEHGAAAAAWPYGAGAIVALGFDAGALQAQLLRHPGSGAARTQWSPRLDLLLRQLLHGAQSLLPLPRVAALPAGAAGLVILTLDEDELGEAAAALLDELAQPGRRESLFVAAEAMSSTKLRQLQSSGCELELSWTPGSDRSRQPFGVGVWQPAWREWPLQAQLASLGQAGGGPSSVRSASTFSGDELRRLRILEANAVAVDSSYGPLPTGIGWVCESARPFHPLDRNGRPFALLELPFVLRSDGRVSLHAVERLLRESQRRDRGVLVLSMRAAAMRDDPRPERMRLLLELHELAAAFDHPVYSLAQYLEFRRQRLRSHVRRHAGGWQIQIAGSELALELPALAGSDSVELDRQQIALPTAQATGWHVLPLAAGSHELKWVRP